MQCDPKFAAPVSRETRPARSPGAISICRRTVRCSTRRDVHSRPRGRRIDRPRDYEPRSASLARGDGLRCGRGCCTRFRVRCLLGEAQAAEPCGFLANRKGVKLVPMGGRAAFLRLGCFLELRFGPRSEEHTSELQSRGHLVCRLLLEKKKKKIIPVFTEKKKKKDNRKR